MTGAYDIVDVIRSQPDEVLRRMLRSGLAAQLSRLDASNVSDRIAKKMDAIRALCLGPTAVKAAKANEQHYEVATAFFRLILGRTMKYSCALWGDGTPDLDAAQRAMLDLVYERADIQPGHSVLDLGCGWGAFALYIAERNPETHVLALSNSSTQAAFVRALAHERNLKNVQSVVADVASWEAAISFDRIVAIEMLEHVRNYEQLLASISRRLEPNGRLFVQMFTHRRHTYTFDNGNWIAERFFSGGLMPSEDLLLHFQRDLTVIDHWGVDGTHYRQTAEAWLANLDAHREEALAVLANGLPATTASQALADWRFFFMTCAESFGYAGGQEWTVSQYLLAPRAPTQCAQLNERTQPGNTVTRGRAGRGRSDNASPDSKREL